MVDPLVLLRSTPRRDTIEAANAPIHDYYKWSLEQADLLRARSFDAIDLANIIDEIEAVARSELRSLKSNLEEILLHMLKWDHQPANRSRSWEHSIAEHRDRIAEDLKDSPSLIAKQGEAMLDAYRLARRKAARETRLPIAHLPETCPYSWLDATERPFSLEDDAP